MIPSFILYIIAVVIALVLYFYYDETEDDKMDATNKQTSQESESSASSQIKAKTDFRFSSLFAVLGLNVPGYTADEQFESFTEHFKYFEEVSEACWMAGLESSSLLIGIDFSASNEWKGRKSFNQNCLHKLIGTKVSNPYQKVIWILGQTLAPFDDDNQIPAYGFGDTDTKDRSVFPFKYDGSPCAGFQEVLEWYVLRVRG